MLRRYLRQLTQSPDGLLHMAYGFLKRIQAPYFATGNPETEEMTTLYAPGMLGCLAEFDQGGIAGPPNVCTYQLVKQGAGIQAILGTVLYILVNGSFTVTNVFSGLLAGVSQIAAGTVASYIWIAKRGNRSVKLQAAPTSAADATGKPVVGSSTTNGVADVLALAEAQGAYPFIGACTGAAVATIAPVNLSISNNM